ncbi:MAG: hypothetical protein DYG98_22775 [Haliscomenobacteraceae bacterium CHB4]|nr:hypothetical protein [Saprospiraceae bacterium]MCE7925883.1 hypothetical protein [Haliscomenobacteraceae bacterium CHB4]
MEAAQNKFDYSFEAMQDILERIGRINNLLRMHEQQGKQDDLSVESWRKMKNQLTQQLVKLLEDFNLDVSIQVRAA